MISMTGFGMAKVRTKEMLLEVSIRTVNGRFFEPRIHIPKEYLFLEGEFKRQLGKYIQRGTADIFINRKLLDSDHTPVRVHCNFELLEKYQKIYEKVSRMTQITNNLDLKSLMMLPEVLKIEADSEISGTEKTQVLRAFAKACRECQRERSREGASLSKEIGRILENLRKLIDEIARQRDFINRDIQSRYRQRIESRLDKIEIDPDRLAQEIVIQLDKADITEEIDRLQEHFRNFSLLFAQKEAVGKKMDFYTQELLREVNTIGSKSQVARITSLVVEAKTLIERIREQVQNIE